MDAGVAWLSRIATSGAARSGLATLAALLVGLTLAPARAQVGTVRLADPANFRESFTGSPQVSGRLLVGLHLGRAAGAYESDKLRVALSRSPSAPQFCVRVTTLDARYWALNKYVAERGPGLGRLESPSRFSKELAQYHASQVAVRIIAAPDCHEDVDGPLVPAVLPGAAVQDRLVALVNAGGSQISAELVVPGQSAVTGTCGPVDTGPQVAFTAICELNLPALPPGRARLHLTTSGLTGQRVTRGFDVIIPELR